MGRRVLNDSHPLCCYQTTGKKSKTPAEKTELAKMKLTITFLVVFVAVVALVNADFQQDFDAYVTSKGGPKNLCPRACNKSWWSSSAGNCRLCLCSHHICKHLISENIDPFKRNEVEQMCQTYCLDNVAPV